MPDALQGIVRFRGQSKARRRDNVDETLAYLYKWQFSTADLLRLNLGIKSRSGAPFLREQLIRLDDSTQQNGFFREVFIPSLRVPAITLSRQGLIAVPPRALNQTYRYTHFQRIPETTARHHLYVQRVALAHQKEGVDFIPERVISDNTQQASLPFVEQNTNDWIPTLAKHIKNQKAMKKPDLISRSGNHLTAYEIELVTKSRLRIMRAYHHYATLLATHVLDAVHYIFARDDILDYYRQLFDLDQWPLMEWQERERQYAFAGTTPVRDTIREKFSFSKEYYPYD